ncbi:VENN motif pre-toxin domain-containing protein, partial [Pantoea eucrina]
GEIGNQAADIARTEGQIAGERAKRDPAALQAAKAALAGKGNLTPAAGEIAEQAYKTAAAPFGTGSALQQGIQAATAAVQGLAGGSLTQAVTGVAAPYLAEQIHRLTEGNPEANLMAHAVVGAVVAQASGNSALAGAAGAASASAATSVIAKKLYGTDDYSRLDETQKQTISALSTLAGGLAGGLTGDSVASVVSGAQAGKNTSENNDMFSLPKGMTDYGQSASTLGTSLANSGVKAEEINAALSKNAQGDLPEGANITKVIVDGYMDGVLIAGAAYIGPAASAGKIIGGAVIAEIANGTYQWFDINNDKNKMLPENKQKAWDYRGSASAAVTGGLAPGRGIWANAGITAGGTLFTDGPDKGALTGAGAGWAFGSAVSLVAPPLFNPVLGSGSAPVGDIIGSIGGEFISNAVKDEINEEKK